MIPRYGRALRITHWTSAVLILGQVLLALLNMLLYEPRPALAERLVQAHISLGAVLFGLTAIRLVLRLTSPAPPLVSAPMLRMAARISHSLLYVCLITLPATGYIKLAALGFPIMLFGFIPLPMLPLNIPLAQAADALHDAMAVTLGALVAVHIAAALLHPRLGGNAVLPRITMRVGPRSGAR